MDNELEHFKTQINLATYLQEVAGFTIDKTKSTPNAPVLRHDNGDKFLINRKPTGHYVFCSVHDDNNRGSIIDYVQSTHRCTIGHVRKHLREYAPQNNFKPSQEHIKPIEKDIRAIGKEIEKFKPVTSPYLQNRGIDTRVISHARFANRILQDDRSNTIFPHSNLQGVCGYEMKNYSYTGFSKGGEKGLFFSNHKRSDTALAFFETGIDAISYATAHPQSLENTTFYSLGGNPHDRQLNLITETLKRFPEIEQVILGFDNDKDGLKLAEKVTKHLQEEQRAGLEIKAEHPPQKGSDWNDFLYGLNREHARSQQPSRDYEIEP